MKPYTPKEFARANRLPVETVYKLLKKKLIPNVERIGRSYRIWWEKPRAEVEVK